MIYREEKCHIISVHQREFYYMPVTKQKKSKHVTIGSFFHEVFHQFSRLFPLFRVFQTSYIHVVVHSFFLFSDVSGHFWMDGSWLLLNTVNFQHQTQKRFFMQSHFKGNFPLSRLWLLLCLSLRYSISQMIGRRRIKVEMTIKETINCYQEANPWRTSR